MNFVTGYIAQKRTKIQDGGIYVRCAGSARHTKVIMNNIATTCTKLLMPLPLIQFDLLLIIVSVGLRRMRQIDNMSNAHDFDVLRYI